MCGPTAAPMWLDLICENVGAIITPISYPIFEPKEAVLSEFQKRNVCFQLVVKAGDFVFSTYCYLSFIIEKAPKKNQS